MSTIQSPVRYEYQFVGTTKEQRVSEYEAMLKSSLEKEARFFTTEMYDERVASGNPLYFQLRLDDDVVRIDMLSKGDKELTAEQADYLQKTYNMNNLTKADKLRLLGDLSCFGVISGKEAMAEASMLQFSLRSGDLDLPDGWTVAREMETEASNLRDVSSFDEWLKHYARYSKELDEEIMGLMTNPHADILDIQKAQSKQDY